jgi:polyadenylation factor subunit 2
MTSIDNAHDSAVFSLDWHPLGHILVSGSNDHSTRFWTRNRLGERTEDALKIQEQQETEQETQLPGLGEKKRVNLNIPGLSDIPSYSSKYY